MLTYFLLRASGADTTIACWGQVLTGDGSLDGSPRVRVSALTGVTELVHGFGHACAIVNGTVRCWGDDDSGQLGRGAVGLALVPERLALTPIASFSVGHSHACAITNGRLSCWGANAEAKLGDGTTNASVVPVEIATGLATVAGVSAGPWSTCAWSSTQVRCWGDNKFGQAGYGQITLREPIPVAVQGLPGAISTVELGAFHACAIAGGGLYCWGDNNEGALGDGTTIHRPIPVPIAITNPVQVTGGALHTCALDAVGGVWCWGYNFAGQVGNNTMTSQLTPVAITIGGGPIADVVTGSNHSCARTSAGAVYCWGQNLDGQLGLGDLTSRSGPTLVPLPAAATVVIAGGAGTCAQLATGEVMCWGSGARGQLGNGTLAPNVSLPTAIPALAGVDELERGTIGGCARRGDTIECWGPRMLIANGDSSFATAEEPLIPCVGDGPAQGRSGLPIDR
jgi:alpha-tubulin suppressor-like RCC1 family protein